MVRGVLVSQQGKRGAHDTGVAKDRLICRAVPSKFDLLSIKAASVPDLLTSSTCTSFSYHSTSRQHQFAASSTIRPPALCRPHDALQTLPRFVSAGTGRSFA
jgi:hypothetical protein